MLNGVKLLLIFGLVSVAASQQSQAQITQSRVTILVTASNETVTATRTTGAATVVGHVAVGTAGANTSTYEHSEVWEVVRRFSEECPAATFVTNPDTPHTMTIHTDYQKVNGGFIMGSAVLYQLVLLDQTNNPLYVSKKNWLKREIKPICKIIQKK